MTGLMLRAMLTDTSIVSSDENLCDEDASRPCVSDDVREFLFRSTNIKKIKSEGKRNGSYRTEHTARSRSWSAGL